LDEIRHGPESQFFDRKSCRIKPSKLANHVIGMLNASGGVIALGIGDDGEIEDLREMEENDLDQFRKIVIEFVSPSALVEIEEVELESGELIFLYHIEPDYERLFMRKDNEAVYLRVADSSNGPLNREQVRKLEYNKPIRSFEDEQRPDFDPTDLRNSVCDYYVTKMNYAGSFEDLAVKRNLAVQNGKQIVYKNAAILLFAEEPSKYIPNALVRYVRYRGTESRTGIEFNVVKDERFDECLPRQIEVLQRYIDATFRDYYFLDLKEGKFTKVPEYPREAWLEGIVNALCHRSYNLQGNSIYFRHFEDRIEISNSGPLPAQVTIENIQRQRYSRNPRIARMLSEFDYVRELNEGVPRIFRAMAEGELASPEYRVENDIVTLTLRNRVTDRKETIHEDVLKAVEEGWKDFATSQRAIVHFLFQNHEATIDTLAENLELSTQTVRNQLKKMESLEIVERLSAKKRDKFAVYRFKHK
tara:strand:+ start:2026 stop:3444 length:1419 start_codon:yes stop_codon:yes gene_type:complete